MRKLIVKTALITLASCAGAVMLAALVCLLFFPAAVSNAAYAVGLYGISASYAEKAYVKTNDEQDLKTLVERAILAEKHQLVIKYAPEFINSEGFAAAASEEDSLPSPAMKGNYYGYVTGNLAVAQFKLGKQDDARQTVKKYTAQYVKFNTAQYLIRAAIGDGDKEFTALLLSDLSAMEFEGEQGALLAEDIKMIEKVLGQ